MIKGHVQIDIHNHNSGFTERFEQDNMVTDALKYVIPNYIGANRPPDENNGVMPLATRALGGLMLFDGPLTEDVKNIHFPSEAHLVAYAGQDVNTSNFRSGSKNTAESKELDTGYQSVWDFGTSQANGSIQSLALTNYFCNPFYGLNPNISLHSIRRLNGDRGVFAQVLCYDVDKQEVYFIGGDGYSATSDYNSDKRQYTYHYTFTIFKEYVPTSRYKVSDGADRSNYPESVVQITLDVVDFGNDPTYYVYNGYDGYAYVVFCYKNSTGNGQLFYFKIKLSDYSFEVSDQINVTIPNCALRGGLGNAIVNDGYIYLKGYSGRYIYVVNLEDPVQVRTVDLGEKNWAEADHSFCNYRKGCIKFTLTTNSSSNSRYYYSDAILYPDGLVVANAPYLESTSSNRNYGHEAFGFQSDDLLTWSPVYSGHRSYAYMTNNYLGTICNLSSAVQKTAASSMKVTYTLTDVDDTEDGTS